MINHEENWAGCELYRNQAGHPVLIDPMDLEPHYYPSYSVMIAFRRWERRQLEAYRKQLDKSPTQRLS